MIRKAVLKDVDEIFLLSTHLDSRFSKEHLNEMILEDQTYHVLVVEETSIYGYIIVWESANNGQIIDLVIKEDERQKGFGFKLLIAGLAYLNERGVNYVSLEVKTSNTKAVGLYEKAGFKKEKRIENYYKNEDAFMYVRRFE